MPMIDDLHSIHSRLSTTSSTFSGEIPRKWFLPVSAYTVTTHAHQWCCFKNKIKCFRDTFTRKTYFILLIIFNFQGDLTDVLAKTASLTHTTWLCTYALHGNLCTNSARWLHKCYKNTVNCTGNFTQTRHPGLRWQIIPCFIWWFVMCFFVLGLRLVVGWTLQRTRILKEDAGMVSSTTWSHYNSESFLSKSYLTKAQAGIVCSDMLTWIDINAKWGHISIGA